MAGKESNEEVYWYVEVRDPGFVWDETCFDSSDIQNTLFQRTLSLWMSGLKYGSLSARFTTGNNDGQEGVISTCMDEKYSPGQEPDEEARKKGEEKLVNEMEKLFKGV
ncbi:hypothetical protein ABOM_010251 [Aspergillus bombycis]|uniref:Uncharacterized protein n=1 Tax=Aspergillus bombycis TaxID=109264 RepID=A0A1F7ZPP4_9EURO|nr:hypothetical protein ABOM_010251 [Aspergillus bombycis]OGM41412.1 hypothetical protein ABOM_010251 [Aspergillus bombycis]